MLATWKVREAPPPPFIQIESQKVSAFIPPTLPLREGKLEAAEPVPLDLRRYLLST
jgi:hypothetical protein